MLREICANLLINFVPDIIRMCVRTGNVNYFSNV
jgi:hypothetical protein